MRYRFFANSHKSWQAMFDAISLAKESIYLEMYIFQEDMIEFDFLKLLREKAEGGVHVKIILDSFGSSNLSKKAIANIKESGIELLFLSYFLHRTHRKILIVDETVAFIGGVNLYQSSSLWNDLAVRVRGGKLISSITRSFAKAYIEAGGKDPTVTYTRIDAKKKVGARLHDWLIEHSPVKNIFSLKKIYTKHLSEARQNITLVTPYFMPRRWLTGLLHQAHLRGVEVQILIPKNANEYLADRINYFYMDRLIKLGVQFYVEPKMNHAKIMKIDSKEAIVGSNNLDYLSFELNSEIGIFFNDAASLNRISNIIEGWKKESVLFEPGMYERHWIDYVLYPMLRVLSRIRIL